MCIRDRCLYLSTLAQERKKVYELNADVRGKAARVVTYRWNNEITGRWLTGRLREWLNRQFEPHTVSHGPRVFSCYQFRMGKARVWHSDSDRGIVQHIFFECVRRADERKRLEVVVCATRLWGSCYPSWNHVAAFVVLKMFELAKN